MKRMKQWMGIMLSVALAAGSLQMPVRAAAAANTVEAEMDADSFSSTATADAVEDEEPETSLENEEDSAKDADSVSDAAGKEESGIEDKDAGEGSQVQPDDNDQEASNEGQDSTADESEDRIDPSTDAANDPSTDAANDPSTDATNDLSTDTTNAPALGTASSLGATEELTEAAMAEEVSPDVVYDGDGMPEDAEYWCGHYYYVFDESLTHAQAAAKCESMGGYLATATTYKEYNQICSMITAKSKGKPAYQISDIYKGTDGWYWDTDEELCYTSWAYFDGKDGGNGVHTLYAGRALGWSDEALDPKNCGMYNGWNGTSYIEEGTTASSHHIAIGNGKITFSRYAIWGGRTSVSNRGSMFEYNDSDAAIGYVCEWGDPIELKSEHVFLNGQKKENEAPVTYTYSGDSKQPNSIKVYYDDVELSLNQDYTTEIKSRSQVGVARVIVTGINRFKGVATEYYYVVPKTPNSPRIDAGADHKSITISWDKVDYAKGYRIQYSTQYNFSNDIYEIDGIDEDTTTYTLNDLEKGTRYYIRVAALGDLEHYDCVSGWSSYTQSSTLTGLYITIFSNKNNVINGGHSFLNVENLTDEDVYIGTFKLAEGDNAYIGARLIGDEKGDHYIKECNSGVAINFEGVNDYLEDQDGDNVYRDFAWYTVSIQKDNLDKLYECMKTYGEYSLTSNNCAHFATKAWNSVVESKYRVTETGIPGTLKTYITDTLKGNTATVLRFNNKAVSDIMVMGSDGELIPYSLETSEYLSAVNSIKVDSTTDTAATLKWNSPMTEIGKDQNNITKTVLDVYIGDKLTYTYEVPARQTKYIAATPIAGVYSFKIHGVSDHTSKKMGIVTGSSTTIECKTTVLPGATSKVTCTNVASGIKVSWEKVPGATSYYVYRDGNQIFKTSKCEVTDKDVKYNSGTKFVYKVVATAKGIGDSKKDRSATMYRLMPVGIKLLTSSAAGKMTVSYDKSSGSSGYVIQYSLRRDMSGAKVITVSGADTTSRTFSGLEKGKTYYVQVRTYRLERLAGRTNRYYSGYCTTKSVKIKK